MTERVRFHFDPRCPWCYQTSRWIRRLVELGEVEVSWAFFSLDIANAEEGTTDAGAGGRSAPGLRTAVALRDSEGNAAVGAFYAALGEAIHERGEDGAALEVVRAAVVTAGGDAALVDKALSDPQTWVVVASEHAALVERTRSFGVPTIVLDDGDGPSIFGPVISEVPNDGDAVKLWQSVAWLTRYENFSELKRDRTIDPDLASFRPKK